MKKLFQPASLLLYLCVIFVFFFAGVYFAVFTEAAEGQGLAGGAIVLGYGVIAACIALLFSFVLAYHAPVEVIVRINKILGIIFLFFIIITAYRLITREGTQTASEPSSKITPKTTSPTAVSPSVDMPPEENSELGLGFFTPDFYSKDVFYFYGMPNLDKPVPERFPVDSLVFQQLDGHRYEISYAPPWLVPEHLKMDYEILHFKILSINRDFVQIDVNKTNDRFAYVDRHAGKITYWPDFLLNVHSVEFPQDQTQTVRVKPLNYAG